MAEPKPRIGAGDVEITLDGVKRTLKPTLSAALAISRMNEGVVGAITRVGRLDIDAMVSVVRAGLDLTDKGAEGLDEKVYASGLGFEDGLAGPLTTFLQNVANGGRPRKAAGTGDANPPKGESA